MTPPIAECRPDCQAAARPRSRRTCPARAGGCLAGAWIAAVLLSTSDAQAIPSFARKYGIACQTCHVVYPKLTPFGEAFRRNGYRFPGVDQNVVQEKQIALGTKDDRRKFPHATWPGLLPSSVPLSFGVNGHATLHPDRNSGAGQADNRTIFTLQDLVGEAHLWAGGSFTERLTYFAQVTASTEGGIEIEHSEVLFNDIFGLQHALNLVVGRAPPTLTSFGVHSSYLNDTLLAPLSVTSLFGGQSDAWNVVGNQDGIELRGTVAGRFLYSAGVNTGTNIDIRPTESAYGHVGFKLGGMRLDGEKGSTVPNPARPWEETALTVDAFFYRSTSHFTNAAGSPQDDEALTYGGTLRAQWRSLELDSGVYQERHDHPLADGTSAIGLAHFDELSYVVFPWLVPALRVEYLRLDVGSGGPTLYDWKIVAGVAGLIVQNLKWILKGQIELARGAPEGGWGAAGGSASPSTPDKFVGEIESITLSLAYAL